MTTATAQHKSYAVPTSQQRAETPYVRARREWDIRMGSAAVQAESWRRAALFVTVLLAGSLAGNVYLGHQPKVVPHVIEVDSLGDVSYRGPAGSSTFTPSEHLVRYQLRRWLDETRTITSDPMLLKKNWLAAYKMLTRTGSELMNQWATANDPKLRSQTETTAIEITSAVPVTADSWQIDWRETTWDKFGQPRGKPVPWRAMLKIVLEPPKTREQLQDNPLGLFIDEFHWDRIQAAKP